MSDKHEECELPQSILKDQPLSLLHWLACDVVEHCLLEEKAMGNHVPDSCWRALETKRLWVLGKSSDEQLLKLWRDTWDEPGGSTWTIKRGLLSYHQESYRDAMSATFELSCEKLFNYEGELSDNAKEAIQKEIDKELERRGKWEVEHLAYLEQVWECCGERSPFLLYEGKCPIPKEKKVIEAVCEQEGKELAKAKRERGLSKVNCLQSKINKNLFVRIQKESRTKSKSKKRSTKKRRR